MTRAYDGRLRRAAAEEAKRRIARATAELHAKRGALGTSHAMIAQAAGVSVPTVYKYFPTRNDLIPACTAAAGEGAPLALDERVFEGVRDLPGRVRALASAVFRLHEYYAPWMRWAPGDAAALPALRAFMRSGDEHLAGLVRRALAPSPTDTLVRLAGILLGWPAWSALTAGGRTTARAAAVAADAVVTLQRQQRKETV